jgi:DNA-binding MarR family transcriptional regulator
MTDPRGPRGVRRPVAPIPDDGSFSAPQDHPEPGDPPDPDDVHACAEVVLRASRALLQVMATSLTPVLERVTMPQFRALVLLSTLGPTRIGALAQRLGVHQSTFTRTTDRMVDAGIVRRVENPGNRREVLVEATEVGLAYVREVTFRRRVEVEHIVSQLEPGQRQELCQALEAFAQVAAEPTLDALAVLGG